MDSDKFAFSLRYSTLTSLKLDGGNLLYRPPEPMRAATLKKLALDHVLTNATVLSELLNSMPSITDFSLFASANTADETQTIHPATNLRQASLQCNMMQG